MRIYIAIILCFTASLHAADYYCATNGLDTNPGTEAQPYLSLAKALTVVNAGDTVYLGPGQFDTNGVITTRTGSAGNYVTIDGQNQAQVGSILMQVPYYFLKDITWKGGNDAWLVYLYPNADFCVISNNVFDCESSPARAMITGQAPAVTPFGDAASNLLIVSNRMFNGINEGGGVTLYGNHNLFTGNFLYNSDTVDWMRVFGKTNIISGNIYSNLIESGVAGHADWVQMSSATYGSQYNIFERNLVVGMGDVGGGAQLCFLTTGDLPELSDLIFRNNVFIDVASRGTMGIANVHWWNNTFIRCGNVGALIYIDNTPQGWTNFNASAGHGGTVFNNLFLDCVPSGPTNMDLGWYTFDTNLLGVAADFNFVAKLGYQPMTSNSLPQAVGDPWWFNRRWYEHNGINGGNPLLTSEEQNDFRHLVGSPLIGAGTNLSAYFSDDFYGNPRTRWDIGAFEYIENPPVELACVTGPKTIRAYPVANTNWIAVVWPTNEYRMITMIARREYTNNPVYWQAWSNIYSNSTDASFEGSFIDTNVSSGVFYEYQVSALSTNWICNGITNGPWWTFEYISTGTHVPLKDEKGNVILLVESGVASALATEIATLTNDFIGDGYKVFRHDVAAVEVTNANWYAAVTNTRALIITDYLTDTNVDWTVMILGHVPIPYGGLTSPGGHVDNFGAHPFDWFYQDRNLSGWNDVAANDSTADDEPQWNVPSDGKFDTNWNPNIPQLRLGRVDLNQFPSSGMTTEQLLSQYLNRNHQWRHKQFTVSDISTINFSNSLPSESHGVLASFHGSHDSIVLTNWLLYLTNNSALFANSQGTGDYDMDNSLNVPTGTGYTTNILKNPFQGVFVKTYGSYYGDWDSGIRSNIFQLAFLAADGYALAVTYKEGLMPLDPSAMGEPISQELFMLGANTFPALSARYLMPSGLNFNINRPRGYVSLQGDPTLRVRVVMPPTNVVVTPSGSDNEITWTDAEDSWIEGYHVYRAPSTDLNDFTRLTSTPTVSPYTDAGASSDSYAYMVRTVKIEYSVNRSYYNSSQGSFAEAGEAPESPAVRMSIGGRALIQGNVRFQ